MRWHHRNSCDGRSPSDEERLVKECEAFLTGRLAGFVSSSSLPLWLVLNVFAHGTWQEIAEMGDGRRGSAVTFLVDEILGVAENPDVLIDLQRSSLVPLELDALVSGSPSSRDTRELVTRVLDAVRSFRNSTQR